MADFEIRNKIHTPIWRDPAYLRSRNRNLKFRILMGVLTLACILILALPDKFDYARAISFQLAEGGISAKLLFVAMHLLLLYMALRLLVWRQYLGAFTSIAMVIGLAIIAFTNPFSLLHNTAFIYLYSYLYYFRIP